MLSKWCFLYFLMKLLQFLTLSQLTKICMLRHHLEKTLIKISTVYALKHNATANWVKGQKTGACYCTLQLHFVTHFRFDSIGQIFSYYSASHWPYYVLSLSLIATLTNCCKPAQGPIGYCEKKHVW